MELSRHILELPCIAASSAVKLKGIIRDIRGKSLVFNVPMVRWACGKLEVCDPQLLAAAAEQFPSKSVKSLPLRCLSALAWLYRIRDYGSDFLNRLKSEMSKRGL